MAKTKTPRQPASEATTTKSGKGMGGKAAKRPKGLVIPPKAAEAQLPTVAPAAEAPALAGSSRHPASLGLGKCVAREHGQLPKRRTGCIGGFCPIQLSWPL
jgi:hypothetical protein